MKYTELVSEQQRLTILQLLAQDSDHEVNSALLRAAMKQTGSSISQDGLRTQLAWLEEQQLVSLRPLGNLHIVKLRSRGKDVAQGVISAPGIAEPELD